MAIEVFVITTQKGCTDETGTYERKQVFLKLRICNNSMWPMNANSDIISDALQYIFGADRHTD